MTVFSKNRISNIVKSFLSGTSHIYIFSRPNFDQSLTGGSKN